MADFETMNMSELREQLLDLLNKNQADQVVSINKITIKEI